MEIDLDGIAARIQEVPAPAGNYSGPGGGGKAAVLAGPRRARNRRRPRCECLDIANKGDKPETLMEGVNGFEVSADGKKMLIRKQDDF